MKRALIAVLLAKALLLLCGSLFAQQPTGSIAGLVTDPSGAVVPGAAITVIDKATDATIKLTTTLIRDLPLNRGNFLGLGQLEPLASNIHGQEAVRRRSGNLAEAAAATGQGMAGRATFCQRGAALCQIFLWQGMPSGHCNGLPLSRVS